MQFDFLTHRDTPGAYENEIKELGGKIYRAPRLYPQNYLHYFSFLSKFFSEHQEYKIVHSHIDTMSTFPLYAAKRAGIPNRIGHSHMYFVAFCSLVLKENYHNFKSYFICAGGATIIALLCQIYKSKKEVMKNGKVFWNRRLPRRSRYHADR